MNGRAVRPQGILIWDIEGQEFVHPTTYIGDPRVFESGYAPEMNAVANEMFAVFRDAGYRVGCDASSTIPAMGNAASVNLYLQRCSRVQ